MNPWMLRNMLHNGKNAIRIETEEDLQQLANDLSYDRTEYYCRWSDYDVYELISEGQVFYAATPEFILLQYRYARLDTGEEAKEIQQFVVENPPEKSYLFEPTALRSWVDGLVDRLKRRKTDTYYDDMEAI